MSGKGFFLVEITVAFVFEALVEMVVCEPAVDGVDISLDVRQVRRMRKRLILSHPKRTGVVGVNSQIAH